MNVFGLLGYPLGHSFSKKYFEEKFEREGIEAEFLNFEIPNIHELENILQENAFLDGFAVTIPYKEKIIPILSQLDESAAVVGAVNSVKVIRRRGNVETIGYNTDYIGFDRGLPIFESPNEIQALILGTGGASKAVAYALYLRGITYTFVSRNPSKGMFSYEDLDKETIKNHKLIVNATPLGTFPKIDECADIPYEYLTGEHILYDLVYNPEETLFLRNGREQSARTINGKVMLEQQAEASWKLWNNLV